MNTLISRIEAIGKTKHVGTHPAGSLDWHAQRAKAIGGSDIAAIMNRSPWSSAYTLYHEKINPAVKEGSFLMRTGQILEPAILDIFIEQHPDVDVYSNVGTFASTEQLGYHANPDAIIENQFGDMRVLEIKYTTRYWKDGVPEHYKLQVLWYMYVTGLHNDAYLAALTPYGYQEYIIEYDPELVAEMKDAASEFLTRLYNYVEPPFDSSESSLQTMHSVITVDEELEREVSAETVAQLRHADAMREFWDEQARYRKQEIMKQLAGAKYGYVDGEHVVTLKQRGSNPPYLQLEKW